MNSRFDDIWDSAAGDGASCPVGLSANRVGADADAEIEHLMDAWLRERTGRIECALALDQALRLIAGLLADGEVSPRRRRQADRLARVIHKLREAEPDG